MAPVAKRRLYRKVALERLASPDQLDHILRVTNPRDWISILAVYVVLGGALIWGSVTDLPVYIFTQGVVIDDGIFYGRSASEKDCPAFADHGRLHESSRRSLIIYMPLSQAADVHPGMSLEFLLRSTGGPSTKILLQVTSVGPARTEDHLCELMNLDKIEGMRAKYGPVVAMRTAVSDRLAAAASDTGAPSSAISGLAPGTTGEVKLISGTQKPIQMLLGRTKIGRK